MYYISDALIPVFRNKNWIILRDDAVIDVRADQVRELVEELRDVSIERRAKYVMVIIGSHGKLGTPYGVDGHEINMQASVYDVLEERSCRQLENIPKIIFIQACQDIHGND